VEASPRYKIRPLLTRHPRKNCFPRSFSLQEIFRLENRRFLFSLQQPETGADGQALQHFVLLYFCAIISSAGGVLSRVLLNFFSFEDLHEGFSTRSTRQTPRAARRFPFQFISNSSSIFGRLQRRLLPQQLNFFFTGEVFSDQLRTQPKAPSPTGVVFTTSTDSSTPDQLRCPKQFLLPCSSRFCTRRDQRKIALECCQPLQPRFPPIANCLNYLDQFSEFFFEKSRVMSFGDSQQRSNLGLGVDQGLNSNLA
jgi:hypothetical protein